MNQVNQGQVYTFNFIYSKRKIINHLNIAPIELRIIYKPRFTLI